MNKSRDGSQKNIRINNISESNINIADGDINQTVVSIAGDEINVAFEKIKSQVKKIKDKSDRQEALDILQKLEQEARKGNGADETRVKRWFNFLAELAPDAWEVAIATFINPLKGVGLVFQKVAARSHSQNGTHS